jgi:hypothetical protein
VTAIAAIEKIVVISRIVSEIVSVLQVPLLEAV